MPLEPKLLTVADAAVIMGLSRAALYNMLLRGELRSVKIGRARRIPVSALDAFINEKLSHESVEHGPCAAH